MLILTRRIGESVIIGSEPDMSKNVVLTVIGVKGGNVRVGINAPPDVAIHREEIYERIKREQAQRGDEGPVPSHARDADGDLVSA